MLSITQICYDVGFESRSSFSLLFRKHFKIPPSKLRS
ncbi:AraC family transcriptional regulator [candidate division KSB1 bacterium]|nr:AraC family transcriptional regulator [candidate division KSB1 bacterium]